MTDEFTQHVMQIIIAKAAKEKGYISISEIALDILVEATIERLSAYARAAAEITTHCGRTDTNEFDVFTALYLYRETPETLSQYLSNSDTIPSFEFLIEPYPLPRLSKFYYTAKQQNGTNTTTFPFRANTSFVPPQYTGRQQTQRQEVIPPFFPPLPSEYTYNQTIKPEPPYQDEKELIKRRESDQSLTKQALAQMHAGQSADTSHAVTLNCDLTSFVKNDFLSKPSNLFESSVSLMEGIRTSVNPEFLPLQSVTDNMLAETPTRDQQNMLAIISIVQGTNEPATLKNATYNNPSAPQQLTQPMTPKENTDSESGPKDN